ncbi:MAG: flagellar biosynthetic protein FliR [Acidimicrobiales bacterium]
MSLSLSSSFAVALALAFARSIAWVSLCPPFSNAAIPRIAKVGLAGSLAFFTAGALQNDVLPSTDAQVMVQLVIQVFVGLMLGYVVSLFVNAVVSAGRLVDLFSGMNLPQALDPLSMQQSPIFGQFYNLVVTALLFTTGAATVIVAGFLRSFQAIGTTFPKVALSSLAQSVTGDVVAFFAAAMEIAAPLIAVLFCTQIVLALLSKAAPQVNVFVFGMPLQVLMALIGVSVALVALPSDVVNLVGRAMSQLFGGG